MFLNIFKNFFKTDNFDIFCNLMQQQRQRKERNTVIGTRGIFAFLRLDDVEFWIGFLCHEMNSPNIFIQI